ncbi:MAG: hypothetical protein U0T69_07775 [Chitinophagales bacterium]
MNTVNYKSSSDLKINDVPKTNNWEDISNFALLLNPADIKSEHSSIDLNTSNINELSLDELRVILYIEQRRWNHFCRTPDYNTMLLIQNVIEKIRNTISSTFK